MSAAETFPARFGRIACDYLISDIYYLTFNIYYYIIFHIYHSSFDIQYLSSIYYSSFDI